MRPEPAAAVRHLKRRGRCENTGYNLRSELCSQYGLPIVEFKMAGHQAWANENVVDGD